MAIKVNLSTCLFSDIAVKQRELRKQYGAPSLFFFSVFPFQHGRQHMPHIPTLGYSHCVVIHLQPYVFYPDKPIEVQITVNHIDTSDKSYVHDAAVSWVENTNYDRFTACVMAAGFNERKSNANVTIDWVAYQGAPVGGLAGEKRISQWWTGTTCVTVNFPSVRRLCSFFSFISHLLTHLFIRSFLFCLSLLHTRTYFLRNKQLIVINY